jgi:hypothetical protein
MLANILGWSAGVCWRKSKIHYKKIRENSKKIQKNIQGKYIRVKQVKATKMQAAEQDQTAATRTVAHKKIKISVSIVQY